MYLRAHFHVQQLQAESKLSNRYHCKFQNDSSLDTTTISVSAELTPELRNRFMQQLGTGFVLPGTIFADQPQAILMCTVKE